jgi:hypothetical protein
MGLSLSSPTITHSTIAGSFLLPPASMRRHRRIIDHHPATFAIARPAANSHHPVMRRTTSPMRVRLRSPGAAMARKAKKSKTPAR